MNKITISFLSFLLLAIPASAEWKTVAPGVDYQEFTTETRAIYVVRVDLTNDELKVVSTRRADKGLTVSRYAQRNNAIVAINGDYFDQKKNPLGLAIAACGQWEGTEDTAREKVFYLRDGRAHIETDSSVMEDVDDIELAVSGWPVLVKDCEAISAGDMPGSDKFTRAPHPRSAVGLSDDRKTMYLVAADGRRPGIPGLTLAQLAKFMDEELGVCSAINLDGGGSTALWVAGCLVNTPSDGRERHVGNHIGIVLERDFVGCEAAEPQAASYVAQCPREAKETGTAVAGH